MKAVVVRNIERADEEGKQLAAGALGLDMYNMREPLAKAGKTAVIPPRTNRSSPRGYDRHLYGERHLIQWEFPRLCRGGSRSLTFPGVVSGHPLMKLRFVSRQSTRTMEFHQWTSSRA